MQKLWFDQALLPSGWASQVQLDVQDGRIAAIRSAAPPDEDAERHHVAVPGVANLHSHAFQRAAAGRTGRSHPEGDNFWSWRSEIYRLAATLTPEAMAAIAALAYAEMLEAGYTRVGEFHYLHHGSRGQAYDDPAEMASACFAAADLVGIDMTLLPVFYAHSDLGGAPPRPDQARFVCSLDQYARLLVACREQALRCAGAGVGVAPHSLRAVTPDELAQVAAMAANGPIHMHIAEQVAEVERSRAVLGARPVEWLLDHFPLDPRWCLIHATHLTPNEVTGLACSGATVGLCPITEADLGDGLFPAVDYARAGGAWGVGTDSNVMIDLVGELRLLEYGQRLQRRERNVLAVAGQSIGRAVFEQAMKGGQQALQSDDGVIVVGGPATLVSLSTSDPAFADARGDDLLDAWIFAARRPAINRVWRRGKLVVQDGRHLERSTIEAVYRQALTALGMRRE